MFQAASGKIDVPDLKSGVPLTDMSKRRIRVFTGFLFLSFVLISCSGLQFAKSAKSSRYVSSSASGLDDSPAAPWRPTKQHTIPVTMTPQVKQWVNLFQGKLKPNFDRWIYRLGQYGPTIEKVLEEEGAPRDLIYLSMIESGFNLRARSHASAVGPWQFIGSTGRMYGLKADFFVDDRSDLVTATRAAARHLKDLYKTYGDWYLAFAAYNAGPGTVNRAIARTGTKNYWVHSRSRYLRAETKNYVPKILAALHIVKNYRQFGYADKDFGKPLQYDRVYVPDATDITVIAKSAGTSVDVIQELNPALVSGITRPETKVPVYIPKGRKEMFKSRYASIPADKRVENLYHRIGNRETLTSIARLYSTSPARLAKANNISAHARIAPGTSLKIPTNKKVLLAMANRASHGSGSSSRTQYYRVRRGDSLGLIARRHRTSIGQLARLNRINTRASLRVGQLVKIRDRSGPVYAGLSPLTASQKRTSGVAFIIRQEQTSPTQESASALAAQTSTADSDSFFYADVSSLGEKTADVENENSAIADIIAMNNDRSSENQDTQPGIVHTGGEDAMDISDMHGAVSIDNGAVRKTAPKFHIVRRGETLASIARRYRTGVSQLKALNHLYSDRIRINQRLLVSQTQSVATSRYQQPQSARQFVLHRIRSGETLWSLAKHYGVTINDIKRWNQLRSNSLKVNQKVKIQTRKAGKNNVALTL